MADDWWVAVTLHDESHVQAAVQSLHEHEVEDDPLHPLGHQVAVSADDSHVFL